MAKPPIEYRPKKASGRKAGRLAQQGVGEVPQTPKLAPQTIGIDLETVFPAQEHEPIVGTMDLAELSLAQSLAPSVDPEPPKISKSIFDRNAYQRVYMRDKPKAEAEGLKVDAWRKKHGLEDWQARL